MSKNYPKYDFLIVGAGLFGAVFAQQATASGKRCLVLEKRSHVAGNIYTEKIAGIQVHRYGAHIFHTNKEDVWEYVNKFADYNNFVNSPIANYRGEKYNLPFNMNTFQQMWGVNTPEEAQAIIEEQRAAFYTKAPKNLEQQAINLVGTDIYTKLIRGYTEKQWGRSCTDLPPFIIKRIPVRFTFNNNYFDARFQGIPGNGYTAMVENMLEAVDVRLNTNYLQDRKKWNELANQVIYTGPIDEYFNYKLGALEYRGLHFEDDLMDIPDFQGNAVVNYTDSEPSYTRIIEHKHFQFGTQPKTLVTREYSKEWKPGEEPYYPINDEKNMSLLKGYQQMACSEKVIFGGRLGEYKYYDMDCVVEAALKLYSAIARG